MRELVPPKTARKILAQIARDVRRADPPTEERIKLFSAKHHAACPARSPLWSRFFFPPPAQPSHSYCFFLRSVLIAGALGCGLPTAGAIAFRGENSPRIPANTAGREGPPPLVNRHGNFHPSPPLHTQGGGGCRIKSRGQTLTIRGKKVEIEMGARRPGRDSMWGGRAVVRSKARGKWMEARFLKFENPCRMDKESPRAHPRIATGERSSRTGGKPPEPPKFNKRQRSRGDPESSLWSPSEIC
jgi:hypothetical protein